MIELGIALCGALAHLHAHGLVHRDVKPSNIIFVDGRPKLADIGLVAGVDEAKSFVGTEGYIPPEGPGSSQADRYSLGMVLYEAATGMDRHDFPQLPESFRGTNEGAIFTELNAIILKACAPETRLRYQSADQMRDDLELLRAGRSVRRRRLWQRKWTTAKKFVAVCIALVPVAAVIYWFNIAWLQHPDFVRSKYREANEDYDEGLLLLHNDGTWQQAVERFESAIKKDPKFAGAYAQLAAAWIAAGNDAPRDVSAERARSAAQKAIALNPYRSQGHVSGWGWLSLFQRLACATSGLNVL